MQFKRSDRRKVKANVDLTPLIDVVFQLIIFFMLSSTFVVQSSIPLEIPVVDSQSPQLERKDLTILMNDQPGGPDGNGRIMVVQDDEIEINSWEELATVLSLFQERTAQMRNVGQDKPQLLINSHKDLPIERVLQVLSIANSVGIEQFNIGADTQGENL